jgi:hypothetical protein
MQQLLRALRGAARAEVVPAELLSQLLVAVDNAEPAPNPRLGRVSLSSAYLSARKEGRFSNSPWRTMSDRLSKPKAAGLRLLARPLGQGRGVSQVRAVACRRTALGELPPATDWPSVERTAGSRWTGGGHANPRCPQPRPESKAPGLQEAAALGPWLASPTSGGELPIGRRWVPLRKIPRGHHQDWLPSQGHA